MGALGEDRGVLGLVLFLLTGGGGAFLYGIYKDWRTRRDSRPSAPKMHEAQVDASMYAVVRARDELQEDLLTARQENERLRDAMARVEARAAQREADLQDRIEHLESRLRGMLDELQDLKNRRGMTSRTDVDS